MVEFGSGRQYAHPMDREYGRPSGGDTSTNDIGVGVKDIGFSLGLGPVQNVQALAARMRPGMKKLELTFMGMGKGNAQAHTPGMYGSKQRQALKELQAANKFDFTTHASVGIMGLAGMDQRGNFSKEHRERAIDEIKNAIDFAADVTGGGPIVVHSGEFIRPIADADWNQKGPWKDKFHFYGGEEKDVVYRVVDNRTGETLTGIPKSRKVSRPVWNRYEQENERFWKKEKGQAYKDEKNNIVKHGDFIDYEGNKVISYNDRVPRFNFHTGEFEVQQIDWKKLQDEAQEMSRQAQGEFQRFASYSDEELERNNDFQESIWRERIKAIREGRGDKATLLTIHPEEAAIVAALETNAAQDKGWAFRYSQEFDTAIKKIDHNKDEIQKAQSLLEHARKQGVPKHILEQMQREAGREVSPQEGLALLQREVQQQVDTKNQEIDHARRAMKEYNQTSSAASARAEETKERMRYIQSAPSYALQQSYEAYADAAVTAMRESRHLEQKGQLKRPLALAVENLFPESYGAHPDELINLVEKSRDAMVRRLTKEGMDQAEAVEKARQHLFATFDTAHCNMWWKYWKGDENKTMAQNKEEFDKWMLSKVEEMAKKKIVGHLHLVDNQGYADDHLAPGEGNAPVDQALRIFKKHGFKGDIVVEPGADFTMDVSGTHTLLKAWRHFGSPVYGSGFGKRSWEDVGYGYFGQNQPPYFVFGAYSPSEDWTMWSGVPLE